MVHFPTSNGRSKSITSRGTAGRLDAQRDKGRDRKLRRVGWQVDRVTDVELEQSFDATIDELVELVDDRRNESRRAA